MGTRVCAVISVALLVCPFYVIEAMSLTPMSPTESQAPESDKSNGDTLKVDFNCSFEQNGPL